MPKTNQPSPMYQLNSKNILKNENETVKLKNQINNLIPSIEESSIRLKSENKMSENTL